MTTRCSSLVPSFLFVGQENKSSPRRTLRGLSVLVTGCHRNISDTRVRVLPPLSPCAGDVVYSIPPADVHPGNGRASLQNHSHWRSCTGQGELGFLEALCMTARALHHGSSTGQVGQYRQPSFSTASTLTCLRELHCQQYYCCIDDCYTSTGSVCVTRSNLFRDGCCIVCTATICVD
jgi:hypothetical protein